MICRILKEQKVFFFFAEHTNDLRVCILQSYILVYRSSEVFINFPLSFLLW